MPGIFVYVVFIPEMTASYVHVFFFLFVHLPPSIMQVFAFCSQYQYVSFLHLGIFHLWVVQSTC